MGNISSSNYETDETDESDETDECHEIIQTKYTSPHTIKLYVYFHNYKYCYEPTPQIIYMKYSIYDETQNEYEFVGYYYDTILSPLSWCAVYTNDWNNYYYTGFTMNGKAYKLDTNNKQYIRFHREKLYYYEKTEIKKDAILCLPKQYSDVCSFNYSPI